MPQPAGLCDCRVGTFLPYQRDAAFATLLLTNNDVAGAPMFIFKRPVVAPLLALATLAMLVVLDSLVDLSALIR